MASKWEYSVLELEYAPYSSELQKRLNAHGEEGWEIATSDIRRDVRKG
jgi:hypothetical protein